MAKRRLSFLLLPLLFSLSLWSQQASGEFVTVPLEVLQRLSEKSLSLEQSLKAKQQRLTDLRQILISSEGKAISLSRDLQTLQDELLIIQTELEDWREKEQQWLDRSAQLSMKAESLSKELKQTLERLDRLEKKYQELLEAEQEKNRRLRTALIGTGAVAGIELILLVLALIIK